MKNSGSNVLILVLLVHGSAGAAAGETRLCSLEHW